MKVATLFSGGKDSTFATYWAITQGWDVACLVSLKSANKHSYMFHTPNIDLASLQAEAMRIPLILHETLGGKETELDDLKEALVLAKNQFGITGVIVGAIASNYQEERVNRICHNLGLKTFNPLWHKNQLQLMRDMISSGFQIILTHVSAEGLGSRHLGRSLDGPFLDELARIAGEKGLNPAGEGGEFESLVINGPLFLRPIHITGSEIIREDTHAHLLRITTAELAS
ncbi:diphthine--ammonia ligase [Candidatus Woesearchaeota archaeon]|nr:diphthine--ammonia ligase [Candidatus Woesearchaeota archaeon]